MHRTSLGRMVRALLLTAVPAIVASGPVIAGGSGVPTVGPSLTGSARMPSSGPTTSGAQTDDDARQGADGRVEEAWRALAGVPLLALWHGIADATTIDVRPGTFNELRHDAALVRDHYRAHPEQRAAFGGVHRTHGVPPRLVVMVTDDPPARPYAWESGLRHPDQLRVRVVDHSEHDLLLTYRRLGRNTDKPWMRGWTGTLLDGKRNRVVVHFLTGRPPDGFTGKVDMDQVVVRQKGRDRATG